MDNIKNYLVVGIVVVTVVLGVAIFQKTPIVNNTVNVPEQTPPFGAIPGTSIDSNIFSIGGVQFAKFGQAVTASSSVLCAVQNPFRPATSTIDRITVRLSDGFTVASAFDISTSTGRFGSSTVSLIDGAILPADAQTDIVWTPRNSTTSIITKDSGVSSELAWSHDIDSNPFILKGSEWITVRNATGTPGNETVPGFCNFEFTRF